MPLLTLQGPGRRTRRLVPLRPDQRSAVVTVYRQGRETKELHQFRVEGLPADVDGRSREMRLTAVYDGGSRVELRLEVAGRRAQTATVRVPRRRRFRWGPMVIVLVLAGAVGGGLWWVLAGFTTSPGQGSTLPASDTTDVGAPPPEPESRESASSYNREPEESSPPPDPPPAPVQGSSPQPGTPVADGETTAAVPAVSAFVYFDPNDTRLTPAARRQIAELVVQLNRQPSVPVSIVGHTALFGTEEGRMEISRGRAQAVEQELRNLGWRPETPPQLGWVGSSEPVTRVPERQNENRRVRIRTVPRDE